MHRPEDFASEFPPQRIIGTEMEYHVQPTGALNHQRISDGLAEQGILSAGEYRSNGSRIYPEFGLEYASPECRGPKLAAAADFAGMQIVQRLFDRQVPATEKTFPVLRHSGSFDVSNRRTQSRGYHENYLTPYHQAYSEKYERTKAVLGSFLATRIIWDGAGLATNDGYLLSQKASGIGTPVANGYGNRVGHGSKPLAGLLSGTSAQSSDKIGANWGMLEVRSADAHMSQTLTWRSLAVTSMVLRLVEQDIINADNEKEFILTDPVRALHETNHQGWRKKLQLANDKTTTARGLQQHFAEAGLRMRDQVQLPGDEYDSPAWLLSTVQKLGRYVLTKDLEPLDIELEWATKLRRINAYADSQTYGPVNKAHQYLVNQVAVDLQWHRIDNRSAGLKVYNEHDPLHANHPVSPHMQAHSRADARGGAIGTGSVAKAAWNQLSWSTNHVTELDDFWSEEPLAIPKSLLEP